MEGEGSRASAGDQGRLVQRRTESGSDAPGRRLPAVRVAGTLLPDDLADRLAGLSDEDFEKVWWNCDGLLDVIHAEDHRRTDLTFHCLDCDGREMAIPNRDRRRSLLTTTRPWLL